MLVRGGDAVAAPAGGRLLFVPAGVLGGEVVGGAADGEGQQEAVDDDAAGGELGGGLRAVLVLGGGYVAERWSRQWASAQAQSSASARRVGWAWITPLEVTRAGPPETAAQCAHRTSRHRVAESAPSAGFCRIAARPAS